MDVFNGKYIGILHPFHFCIDETDAGRIAEVSDLKKYANMPSRRKQRFISCQKKKKKGSSLTNKLKK